MKKVLLIMPIFHEYHDFIIKELENQNYEVTFLRDGCDLNILEKIYNKIDKQYAYRKYNKIFNKKMEESKTTQFDFALIIFGAVFLNENHFKILKQTFECKIIYYAWDNVASFSIIEMFFKYADKAYTFDKNDALLYHVTFLPLFYISSHNGGNVKNHAFKWQVSTVMSVYPQKLLQIDKLVSLFPKDISKNIYLYFPGLLQYYKMMFKYKNILKRIKQYSHFKLITFNEANFIVQNSFIILDSTIDIKRNGISILAIEALALHKKIITMQQSIKDYDFYTPTNIFVVGEKNDKIPDDFFVTSFDEKFSLDESYYIGNFVKTLTKFD